MLQKVIHLPMPARAADGKRMEYLIASLDVPFGPIPLKTSPCLKG